MKPLLLLLVFIPWFHLGAQNPILQRIDSFQVRQDDFYDPGLFPSQVYKKKRSKAVEDNNIFFTALVNFTLSTLRDSLSENDRKLIDKIRERSLKVLPHYANRKGGITYNFYQVWPEDIPFPNFRRFSKMEKAKLPDDLDDAAFVYLMAPQSDSLHKTLKQLMNEQSSLHPKITSTYKEYRYSKAYRTWFADQMKEDIDVCVNSNVLLWVHESGIPLDSIDSASIDFIRSIILNGRHRKHPFIAAVHYPYTSVILYHVSRLLAFTQNPLLEDLRPVLISDLRKNLSDSDNEMERVILSTSLMRLGEEVDVEIDEDELQQDMRTFIWFNANLLYKHRPWLRKITIHIAPLNIKHICEAYYWSLYLEFSLLNK